MSITSIFRSLFDASMEKETSGPVLLMSLYARAGIPNDFGSAFRDNPRLHYNGTPPSVLAGCRKLLVAIPGENKPAVTKEGKPIISRDKRGTPYHVMDQYSVPVRLYKQMVNDQKRKAAGRWYSGAKVAV